MDSDAVSIATLIERVSSNITAHAEIRLRFGSCKIHLQTNSGELVDRLAAYFAPFSDSDPTPDIMVTALEMPPPELDLRFNDWKRDPGKIGSKDTFFDFPDGRACRKVKTGMQYLMGDGKLLIFGECLKNDNQVVNFLISQYITCLMHRGWVLCHAAAVAHGDAGLAIAAFSGGGKSTLALHMMRRELNFVSNDRTLIKLDGNRALVNGVPKQPRINPGTAINNPDLASIIPEKRQLELASLSPAELWELEEKYDADVEKLFRPGCFRLESPLNGFLILNWNRQSDLPTDFKRIDIQNRPDLLAAVMKPPGVFYIPKGSRRPSGFTGVDEHDYLPVLGAIPVFEASGRIDFEKAVDFCLDEVL